MNAHKLYQLMVIDHQLSTTGVHLLTTAAELGVTPRTIWRQLALLRSVGCDMVCRVIGSEYRHFYVGERLFNGNHNAVSVSSLVSGSVAPPPETSLPSLESEEQHIQENLAPALLSAPAATRNTLS
jgi:predicted DNA-binding transcriptional regulator YafY